MKSSNVLLSRLLRRSVPSSLKTGHTPTSHINQFHNRPHPARDKPLNTTYELTGHTVIYSGRLSVHYEYITCISS